MRPSCPEELSLRLGPTVYLGRPFQGTFEQAVMAGEVAPTVPPLSFSYLSLATQGGPSQARGLNIPQLGDIELGAGDTAFGREPGSLGFTVFGNAWRLGRLGGVEIRVDSSWIVIALLITYSLYIQFTEAFPVLATPGVLSLAILFSLLFFGSVLIHELAHAVVARRRGIPVRGITLFLFGGATHAKVEARGPKDELVVSIVGPLTSLIVGGLFWLLGTAIYPATPPLGGGFRYLGGVNVVLAVFNMLPGFPLDGGRVLRSLVWRATGSLNRATRVASIAGQAVGYLMIAAGVFFLIQGILPSAIWLAAIGWFLAQAARSSYAELQVRRWLESVEAEDLLTPELISVPPDITLREAADRYLVRYDHGAFPVKMDGRTIGLLTLRGVKRVPQEAWSTRTVSDTMEPLGQQCSVEATARMDEVLAKLQDGRVGRCLVIRDGDVVGIITPSDVARWLERRQAFTR
jgi:Zn-dependent protease/predicted transcriptional regulator